MNLINEFEEWCSKFGSFKLGLSPSELKSVVLELFSKKAPEEIVEEGIRGRLLTRACFNQFLKKDWKRDELEKKENELVEKSFNELKSSYEKERKGLKEELEGLKSRASKLEEEIFRESEGLLKEIQGVEELSYSEKVELLYRTFLELAKVEEEKGIRGIASKFRELDEIRREIEKVENRINWYLAEMEEQKSKLELESREKLVKLIGESAVEELRRRGIIEGAVDDRYIFSKKKVVEILAERAFKQIENRIKGMSSTLGSHRSEKFSIIGELDYCTLRKLREGENCNYIAIIPSVKRSLERNATSGRLELSINEEDILTYERRKNVAYAMALVIDTSGSMEGTRIEGAKECALGLTYFVKRRFKRDKLYFFKFSHHASEINEEDLPWLAARGNTNTAAGIRMAREKLGKYRRHEKLIWLITDGKPNEGGGLEGAIEEARRARREGIELTQILLRGDIEGARAVAEACKGSIVEISDPRNIGVFCILDYRRRKLSRNGRV